MARDGKYAPSSGGEGGDGNSQESLVQTLADELSNAHFIKRFFPLPTTSNSGVSDSATITNNPLQSDVSKEKEVKEVVVSGSSSRSNSRSEGSMNNHCPRREDSLSMAKMVHQRKQAAFQEELLTNPFFSTKSKKK